MSDRDLIAALDAIEDALKDAFVLDQTEDGRKVAYAWRCARARRVVPLNVCPVHNMPDCSPLLNGCAALAGSGGREPTT